MSDLTGLVAGAEVARIVQCKERKAATLIIPLFASHPLSTFDHTPRHRFAYPPPSSPLYPLATPSLIPINDVDGLGHGIRQGHCPSSPLFEFQPHRRPCLADLASSCPTQASIQKELSVKGYSPEDGISLRFHFKIYHSLLKPSCQTPSWPSTSPSCSSTTRPQVRRFSCHRLAIMLNEFLPQTKSPPNSPNVSASSRGNEITQLTLCISLAISHWRIWYVLAGL